MGIRFGPYPAGGLALGGAACIVDEVSPVGRRRVHRENRSSQFLRNFTVEMLWLLIGAIGLFLLLELANLRSTVTSWAGQGAHRLLQGAMSLDDHVGAFLSRLSPSDLLGFALVLIAVVAILLRVRWRLLNTVRLARLRCPRCDGSLYRIHRTGIDRFISFYVPVRRYRCRADRCSWSGLRTGRGHGVSEHTDAGSTP